VIKIASAIEKTSSFLRRASCQAKSISFQSKFFFFLVLLIDGLSKQVSTLDNSFFCFFILSFFSNKNKIEGSSVTTQSSSLAPPATSFKSGNVGTSDDEGSYQALSVVFQDKRKGSNKSCKSC
jgi:hypothetical protein